VYVARSAEDAIPPLPRQYLDLGVAVVQRFAGQRPFVDSDGP
jgi:hypothetical protein